VARQFPDYIKRTIAYDKYSQHFVVRLFDLHGKIRYIHVTQTEIADNVTRGGGSWMDNSGKDENAWPSVIETAYAKMFDTNPKDGLTEGYNKIAAGGWPKDAMMAITGFFGSELSFHPVAGLTRAQSIELLGSRVARALKQKRFVSLWTIPETSTAVQQLLAQLLGIPVPQDGLVDDHVYTVLGATQDLGGEWSIVLRNPWGTNIGTGEGLETADATVTVSLQRLVNTGGLKSFRISDQRIR
jgi:hypothetical protein